MRIGFVGIGNMGSPMAAHLLASGFDVTLYDLRRQAVTEFVDRHGGRPASSLIALARACDVVITMLPDSGAVRRAVLGEGGDRLAEGLAAGAVVIDMGTSDPVMTIRLGEDLAARGIHLVDAPVMGGVAFARDGTLDIMAGGDAAVIRRCRPALDAMGRKVFLCGPLGAAHAMKALLNYVNATALVALLEALTVGARYAIDVPVMIEAMQAMCNGRNHPLEKKVVPQVLERKFATGMSMGLIAKDLGIATGLAGRAQAPMPLGERCKEVWDEAVASLGADKDQTCIARYYEERARVRLEVPRAGAGGEGEAPSPEENRR